MNGEIHGAVAMAAAGTLLAFPAAPGSAAHTEVTLRDVVVPTPDGSAEAVLAYPAAGRGLWPAVILWHDLGGLRPGYRDLARTFASHGFVVLVPNAFYRSTTAQAGDVDLCDPDVFTRQTAYCAAATGEGIARDALAYVAYLDTVEQTGRGRMVGTVGYDVGASYAIRAAAALPERIAAVATFYGRGVATNRPDSPHLLIPKTKAAYVIVQSKDDHRRDPAGKNAFAKVIADGRLQAKLEVYPANHGFALPSDAAHDAAAAQRATNEIVVLFRTHLSGPVLRR